MPSLPAAHDALVIEADPLAAELLQRGLEDLGFAVTWVDTWDRAWTQIQRHAPRLIVAPLAFESGAPKMGIRRLRALEHGSRTVVLATHPRQSRPDRHTMEDLGIDDFLACPIDPDELEVRLSIARARVAERLAAAEGSTAPRSIDQTMVRSDEATVVLTVDVTARATKVTSVNPAFERLTGYGGGGVTGRSHRVLVETRDSEPLLNTLLESAQQNRAASIRVRGLRQDGRSFSVEWSITPVQGTAADARSLLCILRPTEGLSEAVHRVQTAEEKFRNLVDVSLQGVLVHQDWNLRFVNRTLAEMLGYPDADTVLAKGRLEDLVAPEDRERLIGYHQARKAGHAPERYELRMVRRDGSLVTLEGFVRQVSWEGQPAVLASYLDITEQKRAQQELLANRAMLQAVFDAIPHNVYVKDKQSRYLAVNRALAETWKRPAAEIIGQRLASGNASPTGELEVLEATDRAVLMEGQRSDVVMPRTIPGVGLRRFRVIKVPLLGTDGKPMGLVGISEDVTERMQHEEQLGESRALLQAVFDTIPHDVFVKDRERRFVMINESMSKTWQRNRDEALGHQLLSRGVNPPEERAVIDETDRLVLEEGRSVDQVMSRTMIAGAVKQVRLIKRPLRDAAGNVTGLVGLAEDITQSLDANNALRRSQDMLHAIFDTIPHGLFMKDREGRLMLVNQQLSARWGVRPEDMIGQRIGKSARTTPEEEQRMLASDRRVLIEGLPDDYTAPRRVADGTQRQIRYVKAPLRNHDGEIVGLVGIAEDITDRLRSEEELRQSRALFQTTFDTMPAGVYVKDRQSRFVLVNRTLANWWQQQPEAFVGQQFIPGVSNVQAETEAVLAADRELFAKGKGLERVLTVNLPRGARRIRMVKTPLRNGVGEIVGLVGIDEDITEQVADREALQRSQALLRTVFDTIPHNLFVKDEHERYLTVNRAFVASWGGSIADYVGKLAVQAPGTPPEEMEHVRAADRALLTTGVMIDEELTRTTPTGIQHHRLIKAPVRGPDGQIMGLVGIAEDITARKRADEALRDSQRLLQTVFDTLPQSLSLKDANGDYVLVNEAFLRRNGVAREAVLHGRPSGLPSTSAQHAKRIEMADRRVVDDGAVVELPDLEFTTAKGDSTWVRIIKAPFRDSSGKVSGIVSIAEDHTERKRAEESLRDNQRLLQTVINALPQSIYVKDLQGRYQLVNSAVINRHEIAQPDILQQSTEQLFSSNPEAVEQILLADREVLRTGSLVEIPEVYLTPPGRAPVWVRAVKTPLRNDAGNIIGIITIADDITARKLAEAERLEMERQMLHAQKLESLGVLAGGIAHDFNNLLTGILGNVELALMDAQAGLPAVPTLQHIKQASLRAAGLTQQMLAYSGRGRLEIKPLDMSALVEEMAQLLKVSISKRIGMHFDLARDLPAVEGDATQLQQIVMNLITNASEAIGDAVGAIHLSTGTVSADRAYLADSYLADALPEGPYVYMDVADTGVGMSEDVKARIFDPFFTTKFTGRGLGLAAVLGIVRSHRGTIRIDSAPGKGSTFRVLFPAASGTVLPLAASVEAKPRSWRGHGTILVVDDETIVRSVLQRQLQMLGFQVIAADGGKAALTAFGRDPQAIRAVVLDMTMPDMGGVETLQALRRIRPDVPVIVCTGYSEQDAVERFKDTAPNGFLQKPVPLEDLTCKLQEVLG